MIKNIGYLYLLLLDFYNWNFFLYQKIHQLLCHQVRKVAKQVAEWETRTNQNGSKPSEVIRRVKPVVKIVRSNEPVDETDELRWRAQSNYFFYFDYTLIITFFCHFLK